MLRPSSPTMFSWHGVIVPPEIEEEYQDVIDKLIFGPRRDLNYKKLKGYDNLITVRTNKKHRLLFTTVIHDGKSYLNYCGVMLKHKHNRVAEDVVAPTAIADVAFLQPGVLEHFRQANAPMLTAAEITKDHFVSVSEEECDLPPVIMKREHKIAKSDFNKTKFIVLDSDQQQIAEATVSSRVVIKGDAGSGKTCVIMAHLTRHAENHLLCDEDYVKADAIPVKAVVCVVKSARLCAYLQKSWSLSPVGQRYTKGQVKFRVYSDLIREIDNNASMRREVGKAEFEVYIKDRIAAKNHVSRHKQGEQPLSEHFLSNVDYYQEIRAVAAVSDFQEYKAFGSKQSQVNKEDREWFFDRCKDYQAWLVEKQLIDFSLHRVEQSGLFSLVVADEAGDYSRLEINALCKLSENSNVLLCYDQNQRLDEVKDQLDDYKAELNAKEGKMPPLIRLTHTYRCGTAIAGMANQISTIRYKLTQRKLDPMRVAPSVMHAGHVELLTELSKEKLEELRQLATLPNFAVITVEENKKAAMAEFNTKEVYTVKEMKGLDCDNLVVYRLMERQGFYDANKALAKGEHSEKSLLDWNEYYTACTRAIQRLYIVETAKNKLKNILVELRKGLPVLAVEKPKSYTDQDIQNILLRDLRKHAANGDIHQARAIGSDPRLKMTVEEVEKVIRAVAPVVDELVISQQLTKEKNQIDSKSVKKNKKNGAKIKAASAGGKTVDASKVQATLFSSKKECVTKPFNSASILKTEYTIAELEAIAKISEHSKDLSVRLNDLFIIPNGMKYLFNTPLLKEKEDLFTLLLDNPVTRKVIVMIIFPRHFSKLLPHLSRQVLNRGKRGGSAPLAKMPPLFWICHCDVAMGLIRQNDEFDKFWKIENLSSLMTVAESGCSMEGTSALYWLAVHSTSHHALAKLVRFGKLGSQIEANFLLAKCKDNILPVDKQFSIFDHLFSGGEAGIGILIDILTQQPNLAYQLKLQHLFPLPDMGDGVPPLLSSIIKSKNGIAFLRKLQMQNPEFAPFNLTESTPKECATMQRFLRPLIKNTSAKHEYILTLLQRSRSSNQAEQIDVYKSLELLITDQKSMNNWYHYLFNIPVAGDKDIPCSGESLLFNLMYMPKTRPDTIKLILKYQSLMRIYISIFSLYGMNTKTINTPFVWMIHSAELRMVLLSWLSLNTSLAKMITTEHLTDEFSYEDYQQAGLLEAYEHEESERLCLLPGANVSIYKILVLSSVGREILDLILKVKFNNRSDSILYDLTRVSYVDPETKENYSVLEYVTGDAKRIPTAFSLIQLSTVEANTAEPDETICKGIEKYNQHKEPIIKNLMRYKNGFPILLSFANLGVHSRSQITEYLFKVFFTETAPDDEIIELYESLIANLVYAYADTGVLSVLMKTLVLRNHHIAQKVNMDLFQKPVKYTEADREFRQQKIAQRLLLSPSGQELLTTLNELRECNQLRCKY